MLPFNLSGTVEIKNWVAALALALLVGVAYSNAPQGGFIWDDRGLIFTDWAAQKGSPLKFFTPSYWREVPQASRGRFRPMRAFLFSLDYQLYGERPAGYHVTNILLHFSCCLMLFFVARKLGLAGPAALAASLLFAVDPVHTESVTWIKNRSDIVATFFVLASFYAFLCRRLAVSVFLFLPALLAKETALAYPVILAFYMYGRESGLKLLDYGKKLFLFAAPAFIFLLLTAMFWRHVAEAPFVPDAKDHLQMILVTLGFYTKLLFVPWPLKAEHEFEPPFLWTEPYLLFGLLAGAALFVLWRRFRDRDYSFYSLAAFAALLPVLNLYYLPSRLIAEQRVYLASAFICLLAATLLVRASARFGAKPVLVLTAALLLTFTGLTYARNRVWLDDASFWKETVRQNPRNYRSNLNLAAVYQMNGDYARAYEYAKAASQGWDAPNVFYTLGFLSDKLGRTDESIAYYQKCLMHDPGGNPDVYNNLAIAYSKKGDKKRAEENFKKALRINPAYSPACFNLAAYYRDTGREALAREYEARGRGERK